MSIPPPTLSGPLGFALEGEPVRRAVGVFEREHTRLATALKRALPFLAKREVPITLAWARPLPISELLDSIPRPFHFARLAVEPGGAPGAMVLDACAIALLLDGVLGGNGRTLPTLSSTGLTAPQAALMSSTVAGIVSTMGEVLAARAGVRVTPTDLGNDDDPGEGTPIVCALELSTESNVAHIFLVLPKNALLARSTPAAPTAVHDPRIARALDTVDLELVVELARVPMRFGDLLALRVGDTIPLDVTVGTPVCVRADNRLLLTGRPTTTGGRLAVRIESRHDR